MAIDFPDSPSVGDQYVASGKTYQWDGTVWAIYGPQTNPSIFKVDTANNRVGINKTSPTTALDVNGDATAGKFLASGSEANLMPSGTTAERPASPTAGMFRFNETTGEPEWYSSVVGDWVNFRNSPQFQVSYLVVAGGGGASGYNSSGGGGAGGFRTNVDGATSGRNSSAEPSLAVSYESTYTVTVGAGGAGNGPTDGGEASGFGSDSVFNNITSLGGGVGSNNFGTYPRGGNGGSGGGSRADTEPNSLGGLGTAGQGFDGGSSTGYYSGNYPGGGGGGAGANGGTVTTNTTAGNGGAGLPNPINGSTIGELSSGTYYLAGGGGGSAQGGGTSGSGGLGGGGAAGSGASGNYTGTSGTANTGGGGGAGNTASGGNGGSGVVILRYPGGLTATVSAGLTSTTTTVGSDKVTVFTAGTGTVSWA